MESPVVCREEHQIYAWQPLSGDAAIEPADNVIRIESNPKTVVMNHITTNHESPRQSMSTPIPRNGHESTVALEQQ